jgi:acetylornithine deacetylase/succinyl-diaminopimelate desuccinylase-like protein
VNPIDLASQALEALKNVTLPANSDFGQAILVATEIVSDPCPSISLIPAAVRIRFDRRTLVGEDIEGVLSPMRDCLSKVDPHAFFLDISREGIDTYTGVRVDAPRFLPAWRLDAKHRLVSTAWMAVERAGIRPTTGYYRACTNGSESAGRRGLPTIILGPGSPDGCHVANESISIKEIQSAAQVYKELALRCAEEDAEG